MMEIIITSAIISIIIWGTYFGFKLIAEIIENRLKDKREFKENKKEFTQVCEDEENIRVSWYSELEKCYRVILLSKDKLNSCSADNKEKNIEL